VAADESGDQTTDLAEFSRIFYDENGNMTKVVFNTLDQKPIEVVEADGRVKKHEYYVEYNGWHNITNLNERDEFYKNNYYKMIEENRNTR